MTEIEKKKLYYKIMKEMSKKVSESLDRAYKYNDIDSEDDCVIHKQKEPFFEYVCRTFDINSISISERKKAYIDYHDEYSLSKCIMFQEDYHDDIIDESIKNNILDIDARDIKFATPLCELYEHLKNNYMLNDWQFKVRNNYEVVNGLIESVKYEQEVFVAVIPEIHNNVEIIKRESRDYGYYLFNFEVRTDDAGMKWALIVLNPLKQPKFNDFIKDNYPVIWHCSPIVLDENIRKNGLKVSYSTGTATYDSPRIFFKMGVLDRNGYKVMMKKVADRNIKINPTREFYAYPIFFEDICDKYEFYKDPNAVESCMCFEDIPFEYVDTKRIKKVKF